MKDEKTDSMYTQNDEEKYILSHFANRTGRLLDIGANDGKTYSNSLALIERGWEADLVEPSPAAFFKLEKLHDDNERVRKFNCAISESTGVLPFWESKQLVGDDVALVSSMIESETEKWKNAGVEYQKIEVPALTYQDFALCYSGQPQWKFISIDVEGLDFTILKQIPLREVGCEMLCIEWNSNQAMLQKITNYVSPMNYKSIVSNAENVIFTTTI